MKKYLVVLVPKKEFQEVTWFDTTLVRIRMYAMAENTMTARKNCENACRHHGLLMKAQYSKCIATSESEDV